VATLPIGFFMPLPLPIMIPFMMWQSAAIAAGFGTYFQYAKRKISAMSNEEFNAARPHNLVNELFTDIMGEIPSSFQQIRSINTLILQSMADFLEDGIKFLSGKLGGQLNQGFQFEGPPTTDLPNLEAPNIPNPFVNPLPQAFGEDAPTTLPPPQTGFDQFIGPPAPPPTQQQLLDKYANWKTYRQKGGLLTNGQWKIARRGQEGGLTPTETIQEARAPNAITQGKIYHPAYFRQLKSLQNNRDGAYKLIASANAFIKEKNIKMLNYIKLRKNSGSSKWNSIINSLQREIQQKQRQMTPWKQTVVTTQKTMNAFVAKYKSTR